MAKIPRMVVLGVLIGMPIHTQSQTGPQARSSQARSMTITQRGIVATSQTLASQAGAQILARGGSAADAAIAANAVLGAAEPMMNGLGGDLFAIHWDAKTGKLTGLNSSGWAPEKLTPELLRQKGLANMPQAGIYSVTVPGCVRGGRRCTRSSAAFPGRSFSAGDFLRRKWISGYRMDRGAMEGGASKARGGRQRSSGFSGES